MRPRWLTVAVLGLVMLGPSACVRRALSPVDAGGTGQVGIDGGLDASAADAGGDANADVSDAGGADGTGTIPCGAVTCTGTDLCVATNLCGGPLNCRDEPDSGQCPTGWSFDSRCQSATGRPGCTPDCPGPSYACVPRPGACTGALDCSCLPASFCQSSRCNSVQGRQVSCANE